MEDNYNIELYDAVAQDVEVDIPRQEMIYVN